MIPRFALYPYRSLLPYRTETSPTWQPPVDVAEEEDRYLLQASVPGIPTEDIAITVKDGILTIKADYSNENGEKEAKYCLRERHAGSWVRRFSLPDEVDEEGVSAQYDQGVLSVELPKMEKVLPRRIAISSGQK